MKRAAYSHYVIGGLVLAAMTGPAWAQEAPPAGTQASEAPGTDIIVTARRRNESLQSTPVAITAISPAQLESKGTVTLADLQGTAPNTLITAQPTGATTANISIRGIAFADVEKSFDPSVGVNVDGVYIGTSTGQLLDFFDIDSIEILRGPQGTLFGRNTIGGVINIRRTRPTGEFGGKFEAQAGSYGAIGLRGVLNAPIVPDVLAVKLFEMHQETDGYYKDSVTGRHLGKSNSENFGAAFLLTPTPGFDALLTLEQQEQKFQPYFGSLTQTGDVFCAFLPAGACGGNKTDDIYTTYPGVKPTGSYRARAATLEMNLDAGAVKFASVTSYRKSKDRVFYDIGTSGLYVADRPQKYHQFSQELRASGKIGDSFDYVAGLYYFDSYYQLLQDTFVFGSQVSTQDTRGKSNSKAAFIDMNWAFAPGFRLSGGGRYTEDKKAYQNPLIYSGSAKKSWSKFTPKVTLDYRPSDEFMVYGTWSRGYRAGGFNGRGQTIFSAQTPYDPETVDSYELGLKTEFLDRKLAINVASFYTDYKDIQQSSTITLAGGQGNETIVTNAAGAKIKGLELDVTARPTTGFTLRGAVGYTDAKFKGFIVSQPVTYADLSISPRTFDFSNVDMIFAPKWTASINATYEVPVGDSKLAFNVGYRFISPYDQQIAPDPALYPSLLATQGSTAVVVVPQNDPLIRSDRQNLVDASVSVTIPMNGEDSKMRLTGFVRNLLDDRGPSFSFQVAAFPSLWHYGVPREPRVFGIQAGFEF
jgi:iron complex outermembrane recepter protein